LDRSISEAIAQNLWNKAAGHSKRRLFAVLDGARSPAIYPAVMDADAPSHCLYRGVIPDVLAKAAPYVVDLSSDAVFLDFLVRQGWGNSWGIFLIGPSSLDILRQHLRRFLKVKDEGGRSLVFRYYDPRVMRVFLPTCDEAQLDSLFSGIERFLIEDADPMSMTEYTLLDSALQQASTSWKRD
jgi:hypothetical protein